MALAEELGQVGVCDGLPCEGDCDLIGVPGLLVHLEVASGIALESGDQLPLLLDEGVEHLLGLGPLIDLEVLVLDPPTERAHVTAFVEGRGHLKTPVGLDAVEVLLVAASAADHALLHPVAELHGRVFLVQPVLLLDQLVTVCLVHGIRNRIGFSVLLLLSPSPWGPPPSASQRLAPRS